MIAILLAAAILAPPQRTSITKPTGAKYAAAVISVSSDATGFCIGDSPGKYNMCWTTDPAYGFCTVRNWGKQCVVGRWLRNFPVTYNAEYPLYAAAYANGVMSPAVKEVTLECTVATPLAITPMGCPCDVIKSPASPTCIYP